MQGDPGLIPPPPPGTRVVKASPPAGAPTPVVTAASPGPLEASPMVQTDSETVRAPAPVVVLRLPDGTEVTVDRALVLGRRPAAPEQQADAVPVAVDDPDKTVSKTHALLRPLAGSGGAGAAVELTDLHSTNGTGYGRDEAIMLEAGGSATVMPPASIWLGTCRLELA